MIKVTLASHFEFSQSLYRLQDGKFSLVARSHACTWHDDPDTTKELELPDDFTGLVINNERDDSTISQVFGNMIIAYPVDDWYLDGYHCNERGIFGSCGTNGINDCDVIIALCHGKEFIVRDGSKFTNFDDKVIDWENQSLISANTWNALQRGIKLKDGLARHIAECYKWGQNPLPTCRKNFPGTWKYLVSSLEFPIYFDDRQYLFDLHGKGWVTYTK